MPTELLLSEAKRPTERGRRSKSAERGRSRRGAVIYSIIESCRRRGVEAYSYLRDVLTRLPSMTNRQIKDIVAQAWAAAEKAAATRKAA
jgi:transposase